LGRDSPAVLSSPGHQPERFGDRVGRVRDPLGNIWWIQSHDEDVDPAELARRPQDPRQPERSATSRHPWTQPCASGQP